MPIRREKSRSGSLFVTIVTIDRPPRNILDTEHCREMAQVLEDIRREDESRVVVIRGAGKCFSTGVEIQEHTPEKMPVLLPTFHDIFEALLRLRAVTIAAVHGYCLGGAAELALACDRTLATTDANIGFPESRVGCYPPVALPLLAVRAGTGRAMELVLEGREARLEDLARWGLVHRVEGTDPGSLVESELARFHDKSPSVVALVAAQLHEEARRAWGGRIREYERTYLEQMLPHPDAAEGIAAFLEKRSPRWQ